MPKKKYIIPSQPVTEEHYFYSPPNINTNTHTQTSTSTPTFPDPNQTPEIWWSAAEYNNSTTGDLHHRFNCRYNNVTGCRATHRGIIRKENLCKIDKEGDISDMSCIEYEYNGEHNHSIEPEKEELDELIEKFAKFSEERKIRKKEKREEERLRREEKRRIMEERKNNPGTNASMDSKKKREKKQTTTTSSSQKNTNTISKTIVKKTPILIKLKKDLPNTEDPTSRLEREERNRKRVLRFLSPADPGKADVPQLREIDETFRFLYLEHKRTQNHEAPITVFRGSHPNNGESLFEVGLEYDFGMHVECGEGQDMQY